MRDFYGAFFRTDTLHDLNEQDSPGGGHGRYAYHSGPNEEAGPIPTWNNTNGNSVPLLGALQSEFINLGRYFTQIEPGTFEEMFRSNLHLMECNNSSWTNPDGCTTGPMLR